MTVPIDAALTTTLGTAFYAAAKNHIPSDQPLLTSPYYRWGMAYNVVVGMGIAIAAYLLNPDWMWMYWLDASRLSAGFTVYVFLMYPAMYTFGFLMADQAEKLRRHGSLSMLAGLVIFLVLFIALTFDRLWDVGTTAQWDAGACVPLIGPGFTFTPLATALTVGLALAVISGVVLLRRFSKGLG
jgi:hypothetical protein